MRIGLPAPPFGSVPPRRYGGTERVVGWLAEALLARGHDVVVFASGDSEVNAPVIPIVDRALWRGERHQTDLLPLSSVGGGPAQPPAPRPHVMHKHLPFFSFP